MGDRWEESVLLKKTSGVRRFDHCPEMSCSLQGFQGLDDQDLEPEPWRDSPPPSKNKINLTLCMGGCARCAVFVDEYLIFSNEGSFPVSPAD